jgi:hypothetical protein
MCGNGVAIQMSMEEVMHKVLTKVEEISPAYSSATKAAEHAKESVF